MIHPKRFVAALLLTVLAFPALYAKEEVRNEKNRVIYECFVRNFSPEGNLDGVTAQIDRLHNLGVDVLWLMPIFEIGQQGRWGTYGSPYAARNYRKISPDLGTDQDFRELVTKAHSVGMEVWLDFAANHTAMDHAWVTSHPDYYLLQNGKPYHINGWNDVYPLNFDNAELRKALIAELKYWVDTFGIDGFRCDYADGPSKQFWQEATSAMPNITWMAESGGDPGKQDLMDLFSYNYAWWHSDAMRDLGTQPTVDGLRNISNTVHNADYSYYAGRDKSRMVYISNHDVVQDKGGTEDKKFGNYLKPMIVYYFTIYGMPLIYNGQEVQYSTNAITIAEKTPINWNQDAAKAAEYTELYTTLAKLKHTEKALWTGSSQGALVNHNASNANVYAYERRHQEGSVIVLLNVGGQQARNVTISSALPTGIYRDIFTDNRYDLGNNPSFTIPARGYIVLVLDDDQSGAVTPPTIPDDQPDNSTLTNSVYINNQTTGRGDDFYIYCYSPEAFGGWPGKKADDVVEIAGTTYHRFDFPEGHYGTTFNLIFHNNKGEDDPAARRVEKGTQVVILGDDYYFTLTNDDAIATSAPVIVPDTPAGSVHYLYIDNRTTWGGLAAYAYANGATSLFGGYPGATPDGTKTVNGITYQRFTIPAEAEGTSHSIIFNNNVTGDGELKQEIYLANISTDYYYCLTDTGVEAVDPNTHSHGSVVPPATESYSIYVYDMTGWDALALYAYANSAPTMFGAWPGALPTDTRVIDGVTYKRYPMPAEWAATAQTIIFNNNNQGTQLKDEASVTPTRDYYFVVTDAGYTEGKYQPQPEPTPTPTTHEYSIYIEDLSGWSTPSLYGYNDGTNPADQLFGGWPGNKEPAKVTFGDITYLKYTVPAEKVGKTYSLIFNNGLRDTNANKKQINAEAQPTVTLDRDYFFTFNATVRVYSVFVHNLTTWGDDLRLYTWWENPSAEFFGAWNTLAPQKFEPNDHVYLRYRIDPALNNRTGNLMAFNTTDPDGTKYDVASITSDRDWHITLGDDFSWYSVNGDLYTRHDDHHIYNTDYTTTYGDNLHVYAYWSYKGIENAAVYEPFGPWPGTNPAALQQQSVSMRAPAADGARQHTLRIPKWSQDMSFNIIINDGTDAVRAEYEPLPFNTDQYIVLGSPTTTGIESITTDDTPVYYNLQGLRVDTPTHGIYIRVRGTRTDKVIF